MNYTPEQISEIVLKVLKEVNTPNLSYQEKIELADNPNTPVETLKVLSTDKQWNVRCGVALNPNTLVETLKVLATDNEWSVRYGVAKHPNTPVETLKVLATDKNSTVRYWVAANPNYKVINEVNTLNLSYQEKLELAINPNTSAETLKVLATDWNSTVRYYVAANQNYKIKNLELTSIQYDALKTLLKSSQVETLKNLTL